MPDHGKRGPGVSVEDRQEQIQTRCPLVPDTMVCLGTAVLRWMRSGLPSQPAPAGGLQRRIWNEPGDSAKSKHDRFSPGLSLGRSSCSVCNAPPCHRHIPPNVYRRSFYRRRVKSSHAQRSVWSPKMITRTLVTSSCRAEALGFPRLEVPACSLFALNKQKQRPEISNVAV
jgi:hypothetical protein